MSVDDESVLKMRVFFSDMDFYPELNNGRYLTLMDLGRIELALRTGLWRTVRQKKWGLVVAGASIRYRHKLKAFRRFTLHTRIVAADRRWFYFHQFTSRKGKIYSSALVRTGITSRLGVVPVRKVLEALGVPDWDPGMPDWVEAWINAEKLSP
jgi:acyl-CoA thioesterase FadM